MKILVAGALGHIGSQLIRHPELLEVAETLILVDDLSTQRYNSLFNLPRGTFFRFIEGSVVKVVDDELLSGVDAVVHLASNSDPTSFSSPGSESAEAGVETTRHLLNLASRHGAQLLFASSTSVYQLSNREITEDSSVEGTLGAYSAGKRIEETIIMEYANDGLPITILRLGTVFGPSPGMRFHTAVNKFCWQASTGSPISVWRTAIDQYRPYVHVSDAASAFSRCVSGKIIRDTPINVVTCTNTVRQVLKVIQSCGQSCEYELIDNPLMTEGSMRISTTLAENLGLEFRGSLEQGISGTLQLLLGISNSQ